VNLNWVRHIVLNFGFFSPFYLQVLLRKKYNFFLQQEILISHLWSGFKE
jgi:hypothetical protein